MRGRLARAREALERPTGNLLGRFVALNILGSGATYAIGFVASVALARWLGPSDRGLFALMLSISSLALVFTGLGLPWATIYYAKRRDATPPGLLGNSLFHAALLAIVLIPLAWLLQEQLASAFGHGRGGAGWILAAALVPIVFLDWTSHGQLQGMMLFGRYNALTVLAKIVYALAILLMLGVFGLGVGAALIATAAPSIVMLLGALRPILASGRVRFEARLYRAMLRYGSRVQIGSIFQTAIGRLDVVILQFFRPLSQVGYYVVAQTIAELVLVLTGAFQISVMPLVSEYEGEEKQAATSADSLRHHGILAAGAAIANTVFGSLVILFAYGREFRPAIVPMLVLLPGIWFAGMAGVIQSDLSGRGRPGLSSQLAGVAAAVTVVLDFALIPPLGVIGAALASLLSYTTYGVISVITLHRVSEIPIRRMMLPTRADFAVYARVLRGGYSRLRATSGGSSPPPAEPPAARL
jgi:O-antigen/teichoic acid export membrane protein